MDHLSTPYYLSLEIPSSYFALQLTVYSRTQCSFDFIWLHRVFWWAYWSLQYICTSFSPRLFSHRVSSKSEAVWNDAFLFRISAQTNYACSTLWTPKQLALVTLLLRNSHQHQVPHHSFIALVDQLHALLWMHLCWNLNLPVLSQTSGFSSCRSIISHHKIHSVCSRFSQTCCSNQSSWLSVLAKLLAGPPFWARLAFLASWSLVGCQSLRWFAF